MRRKRPPALAFILRMDTLRRLARVASLLALDFAGLFLAIFTALCLKAWALGALDRADGPGRAEPDRGPRLVRRSSSCALLFARSGLYAGRAQRPGLTRIVAGLFQTTVVALLFALVNGLRLPELLHLLRLAASSPSRTSACSATATRRSTGRGAAGRRLPAPRASSSGPASTSTRSRTR